MWFRLGAVKEIYKNILFVLRKLQDEMSLVTPMSVALSAALQEISYYKVIETRNRFLRERKDENVTFTCYSRNYEGSVCGADYDDDDAVSIFSKAEE